MALGPGLKGYQISLDRDLVARCDRLAKLRRLHRSTVIRAALRAGLPAIEEMEKAAVKDMAAVQLELGERSQDDE